MNAKRDSFYDAVLDKPNEFELAIFNEVKNLRMENESLKKQIEEGNQNEEKNSEIVQKEKFWFFMKNSSFHGVQDLYASSGFLKIIWAIILVCSIVLAFYGCYSVITEFNESPVVISYFIRAMDTHWILPDVVICPFNRFNRSYLHELNVSENLAQYLEMTYPSPALFTFQDDEYKDIIQNLDKYQAELDELLRKIGNMSFTEFIKELAIDCSAFFKDNTTCDNVTEVMTSMGNCFRIRGKVQPSDGFGHGQRIIVNLPEELYQGGVNQLLDDGIAVKLVAPGRGIDHDLSFISSGKIKETPFFKLLGVHAIMPLKATKFEFKDDPPRYSCNKEVDKSYSQNECYSACIMEPAELACNCSLANSKHHIVKEICTTKQYLECFFKVYYKDQESRTEKCKHQCPPRCHYWQYDKTVSYAKFPSKEAKAFVDNLIEWNKLKKSIILEIYYESLYYTLIKHVRVFTVSNFIAQIGGQLGLWIGGSIISIIQFLIYFVLTGYILIMKKRKVQDTKTTENGDKNSQQAL